MPSRLINDITRLLRLHKKPLLIIILLRVEFIILAQGREHDAFRRLDRSLGRRRIRLIRRHPTSHPACPSEKRFVGRHAGGDYADA